MKKGLFIILALAGGILITTSSTHAQIFKCVKRPAAGQTDITRCEPDPFCPTGYLPRLPDNSVCADHGESFLGRDECPVNQTFNCVPDPSFQNQLKYGCAWNDKTQKCEIVSNSCGKSPTTSCGDMYEKQKTCPAEVLCNGQIPNQQPPIGLGGTGTVSGGNPSDVLVDLNQLINNMGSKTFNSSTTLGLIISIALPFLYAIAGIGLLLMLILGGFNYLTSAGDPKKTEAAKNIITMAVIGFVIVVIAFWLTQIVQYVFGLKSPGGQGLF